jgi:hypothetical protein
MTLGVDGSDSLKTYSICVLLTAVAVVNSAFDVEVEAVLRRHNKYYYKYEEYLR